jgi:hypothetical protein
MPIPNWSNIEAVRRNLARCEANARKAQRQARRDKPTAEGEEPYSPAYAEVMARVFAYADVVREAALREALPLTCCGGRPFTAGEQARLEADLGGEEALHQIMVSLTGLPFGVLDGRGALLAELMTRLGEADKHNCAWLAMPYPQWFDDAPAFVAEEACRRAAEEEARRQAAGACGRLPGTARPGF